MRRLAIVVTHPIQYYAPVFKALSSQTGIQVQVFYTWGKGSLKKYDPGFKREIEWDIPLLDGYDAVFLENASKNPGSSSFSGIINPGAIEEINRYDPHAILIYGWSWLSHLRIIRYFYNKKPVWFRGDSNLLDGSKGWKKMMRGAFLRWIYRHIDKAFYVGTANKLYFKRFGLKEEQLRFAPHAIDNSRFGTWNSGKAKALRNELGIPENGIVILFAGKLELKKDPAILLEAFFKVNNRNAYLLFAGNGVLENELKEKASASSKKDKIHFLDFQNQAQMPRLYQACQLFCLPSKGPGETWGLAVNEAMAAGKAVIVSDKVGCAMDLVKEGVNGSVFRAGSLEELANKLQNLVDNTDMLHKMGNRSLEIIQNWSFEKQVNAIQEEVLKIKSV
jgi:glycosyltransferase involved in cell wall biosynthesis